ncbi:hypothetical protein IEQ34_007950 [Dendrobium chrysotoxum]|uniref:Uncharacterized protein n=1 Tax=Dendrobium chrysotoxum TaxID=161865 RepID=A0AAV7H777_DENCH|nr:hypothetical protein IEQ34_007950 [Dendrobium chrysotoxum]
MALDVEKGSSGNSKQKPRASGVRVYWERVSNESSRAYCPYLAIGAKCDGWDHSGRWLGCFTSGPSRYGAEKMALQISEEEVEAFSAPFELVLVEKFSLCHPNLDVIRKFFFNLKLCYEFSITLLDHHHFLIKLLNDLD